MPRCNLTTFARAHTHAHALARAQAHSPYASSRTGAHAHALTHTRSHTRTLLHTHECTHWQDECARLVSYRCSQVRAAGQAAAQAQGGGAPRAHLLAGDTSGQGGARAAAGRARRGAEPRCRLHTRPMHAVVWSMKRGRRWAW
eukprot:5423618-Pleurochrysis_carterae.AAC.6